MNGNNKVAEYLHLTLLRYSFRFVIEHAGLSSDKGLETFMGATCDFGIFALDVFQENLVQILINVYLFLFLLTCFID